MIEKKYFDSFSLKGIRENNEDSIYPTTYSEICNIFVICDGVGGHDHGEIASSLVSRSIGDFLSQFNLLTPEVLQQAIDKSVTVLNNNVLTEDKRKMGTTAVLCAIRENDILVGHAGDSRLYQIRPSSGIIFKTKDHSKVQEWVDAEVISEEEARTHPKKNIITRCITPNPDKPVILEINKLTDIKNDDYLFMCTDGVNDALEDSELFAIFSSSLSNEEKMENIKKLCINKSRDNFSAILIALRVHNTYTKTNFTIDYFKEVVASESQCKPCQLQRPCVFINKKIDDWCIKRINNKDSEKKKCNFKITHSVILIIIAIIVSLAFIILLKVLLTHYNK